MPDQDHILLQTKLHRPLISKGLILRSRLVEQLNTSFDHPISLICAPAGFGKTTLVCTWLEQMAAGQGEKGSSLPSAWLSLDENDSDLNLFMRYLIAAMRTIFKEACEETLALLQARQQAPEAVLYATLSNELEALPGEAILVLDDYQFIQGMAVHNLLGELVRHWPKQLHLVLISRINPPLSLTGLRARGMLNEIRTRDLRFTPEETDTYLSHLELVQINESVMHLVDERFEGWPAGLHLAALSLRSAASHDSVMSALSGDNSNITGYLLDEVLTHQLPVIHNFLLKTCLLDRFCASLCEAVIGETDTAWDVRACLDWIERNELFITSLDDTSEWYRYHHLFQELLQQRLSAEMIPEQVNALHRQASNWFAEHGLQDEALRHALAAGDLDLAVRQINSGLRDVLNREDRPTLERWLSLLPGEAVRKHPQLLMIRVWALELSWRLDLQAQVIQQVEELLDSEGGALLPADELQILRGQILMIRAQQTYFSTQAALAIELCRQALELLPPSWTFVRGAAMLYLGLAMQASGQELEAERLLLGEYGFCSDKTEIYPLIVLQSLGYIYLWTGQLEKAIKIGKVLIQEATRSSITIMKNWGDYYPGMAHYHRNELEIAGQYFTQIYINHYIAHGSAYRDAVAGLALIHGIKGESAKAWELLEEMSRSDIEETGAEDSRTGSLRARLELLQGDLEGASRWVETFSGLPPDQPIIWLEEPQVTRVRILIARGAENDLRMAQQILDILEEITDRTHNTRYKIEVLALRALALDRQGETDQAEVELKQALDLARPGGFMRDFIDLGRPMQVMLQRLGQQNLTGDQVSRILATFQEEEEKNLDGKVSRAGQRSPGNSPLAEPLTPREIEVLKLLREPLSIKEIAQKLSISHATARRHTINLYGKLGVNRRWDAVAKAEELNLLPPG